MKIRINDKNGDWCFGHSSTDFATDNNQAVAQDLQTKIREWKYNFFANLQAGIDWRTRLGNRGQRAKLDEDLETIITDNENVTLLSNFESFVDDRAYTANFTVYTKFSNTPIDVELTEVI